MNGCMSVSIVSVSIVFVRIWLMCVCVSLVYMSFLMISSLFVGINLLNRHLPFFYLCDSRLNVLEDWIMLSLNSHKL